MLPTICAFVLSFSAFGPDSIEERVASLQGTVCHLFTDDGAFVAEQQVVEVEAEPAVETEEELVVTEDVEVADTDDTVVADEPAEVEVTEVDVAPEVMPETEVVETIAAAPEPEILDEDIDVVVEKVAVEASEELHTTEVVGADLEDVLVAWPHLSEEARKSILLLVRIDMDVE